MSRRATTLLLSLCLTTPGLALAGKLTPEQLATIRRDETAAREKVNAAHGNKKPSEMSNDERRRLIEDQQQAAQQVMEKHGVAEKDYARQTAQMGRKESAAVAEAEKQLAAKEEAAAAAKQAAAAEAQQGPTLQQGFSDENPVTLEETEGAPPVVEQGLPVE